MTVDNYFGQLNGIDVGNKIEKKNGLSYLSWAWAWGELKKNFPDATYTVYENANGLFYHTDGKTCWVKTGVTVNGIEHIEYLPVMNYHNKSIPVEEITSFDVNKAIQRSLTKAVARHGLGLYIYAGEDLPEGSSPEDNPAHRAEKSEPLVCKACGKPVRPIRNADGGVTSAAEIARLAGGLCAKCFTEASASKGAKQNAAG